MTQIVHLKIVHHFLHAQQKLMTALLTKQIVVPLNYFNNFWRSREMPLINCKVYLELNWIEDCILSSAGNTAKFAITDTKLHVPIVTLSTKGSANLAKQLNDGFERSVY